MPARCESIARVRGQRIASALKVIMSLGSDITLLEVMRAVSSLKVRRHVECTQVVLLFLILPCHSVILDVQIPIVALAVGM